MMYLTAMTHPGLTILPAHRMVRSLDGLDLDKTFERLEPYFEIEPLCFTAADREQAEKTLTERIRSYSQVGGKFGMVTAGETCFHLLRLRDFEKLDAQMDPSIPSSLRGLDVTILREVIMGIGLGMDKDNGAELIEYTPAVSEAFEKVFAGQVQISFILNPTRVDQMRAAAEVGHKLPHKSTYFFPKLSSGLVLRVF